jgi:hypothetical protein
MPSDPGEDVGQPGLRVDIVQFRSLCRAPNYAEALLSANAAHEVAGRPDDVGKIRPDTGGRRDGHDPTTRRDLMLSLRGLAPRTSFWRDAQFDTIRLCLIKVAGRVTEVVTWIKIALSTAYPYQIGFADLAGQIAKLPP